MQGYSPTDPDAPTLPGYIAPSPAPNPAPPPRRGAQPSPIQAPYAYAGGPVPAGHSGAQPFGSRLLLGVSQLVAIAVRVVEVGLLLRIALLLLAANPAAGFSSWVYALTAPLVAPFAGVFPTPSIAGGMLDAPAILALIVLALVGRIVEAILHLLARL